jgi:ribonucrease Y
VLLLDLNILLIIAGFLMGLLLTSIGFWIRSRQRQMQLDLAKNAAARIIEEAKKDANAIKKEAEIQTKDSIVKEKLEFEKEVRETPRITKPGKAVAH